MYLVTTGENVPAKMNTGGGCTEKVCEIQKPQVWNYGQFEY